MSLEKLLYMNELFSVYQHLLTDKQQVMLSLYYEEDYSLAEIAEHYGISRQGVHDNIRRGEEALTFYEQTLQIIHKRKQRIQVLEQMEEESNLEKIRKSIEMLLDLE